MSDSDSKEQEIARLTAEVARLREARDAYRNELETHLSQAEKFISNELRLLSVSLSREVREDFFAMLRRGAWTLAILGVIATAGGLFTFSGLIDQAVENEVKKREADVAKLRDNVIQSVVDFKLDSAKALDEIVSLKSEVAKEGRKSVADFKLESESALEQIAKLKSEVEEEGRKAKISIRRSAALSSQLPSELEVVTIPVVVHVVYQEEAQNIADEQILSQITVLNQDFRALNPDISNVPEPFQALIGDARIEFALAVRDPQGQTTSGITRTKTNTPACSTDAAVKTTSKGGADPWDSERYLNIWVCNLTGGVLGYAQFPGGPRETDGVVINFTAFGTIGTARAPYHKGRVSTSIVGRYLNLSQIWGESGASSCSGSDNVADTPNQLGPNYGKPTFPQISCENGPHGDLFMNFMDYVDGDSMVMFTKGQVVRMHETLANQRTGLGS